MILVWTECVYTHFIYVFLPHKWSEEFSLLALIATMTVNGRWHPVLFAVRQRFSTDGGQTSRCICCGICCSQVSGYLVDIRKGQVISRHLRTWCGFRMALLTWLKYLCREGLAANWVTPVRQWCNHNNPKTVWLDVPTADLRKKRRDWACCL